MPNYQNQHRHNEFIPTRLSLLSRLKNWEDDEGWSDFFETYWRLIYSTAVKAGLTDAEAQDVVQETVLSISRSMLQQRYDARRGSFKNWLMRLTRWRIADQLRQRDSRASGNALTPQTTDTPLLERMADPVGMELEALWEKEWDKSLLETALDRVKRAVDPKQFQIFDLYVLKEWPVMKVAQALRVNPGGVYVIKHRISRLLRREFERLQHDEPS
jgi:RNA polymerase sigma factor (sigma-70 family)